MPSAPKNHYFLVLTPTVFRELVYYSYSDVIEVGNRVLVPWGKRELVGIVIEMVNQNDVFDAIDKEKIKSILQILSSGFKTQALFEQWYAVVDWVTQYYHANPGDVYTSAVPKRFLENKTYKAPKPSNTTTEVEQAPIHSSQLQTVRKGILR